MAIMHPYMVHRVAGNPCGRARFAQFPSIALSQPMQFGRDDQRTAALEAAIRQESVASWVQAFNDAGLGCHRVDRIEEIRQACLHEVHTDTLDRWNEGRSISVIRMMDHPVGSPTDNPAPTYARFKHTSLKLGTPMPQLGSDTREILRERGYTDAQIDTWASAGVVKEQLHDEYLPN